MQRELRREIDRLLYGGEKSRKALRKRTARCRALVAVGMWVMAFVAGLLFGLLFANQAEPEREVDRPVRTLLAGLTGAVKRSQTMCRKRLENLKPSVASLFLLAPLFPFVSVGSGFSRLIPKSQTICRPILGAFGSAMVIGSFLFGWPSIIAVVINYVKRSDVRGTYLDSHFSWQIRTFWFALLWAVLVAVVSVPLALVVIGIGTWVLGMFLLGIWAIYRIARGWLALREGRAMPAA